MRLFFFSRLRDVKISHQISEACNYALCSGRTLRGFLCSRSLNRGKYSHVLGVHAVVVRVTGWIDSIIISFNSKSTPSDSTRSTASTSFRSPSAAALANPAPWFTGAWSASHFSASRDSHLYVRENNLRTIRPYCFLLTLSLRKAKSVSRVIRNRWFPTFKKKAIYEYFLSSASGAQSG